MATQLKRLCGLLVVGCAALACKRIDSASSLGMTDYANPEIDETGEKCSQQPDENWLRMSQADFGEGFTLVSIDDDICDQYFGQKTNLVQPANRDGQPVILMTGHSDARIVATQDEVANDLAKMGFSVLRVDASQPVANIESQVAAFRKKQSLAGKTVHVLLDEHGMQSKKVINPHTGQPFNTAEAEQQYERDYMASRKQYAAKPGVTKDQLAAFDKKWAVTPGSDVHHTIATSEGSRYTSTRLIPVVRGLGLAKNSNGTQGAPTNCVIMTETCYGGQAVIDAAKPGALGGAVDAGKVAVVSATAADKLNWTGKGGMGTMTRAYMRAQIDPNFQRELLDSTKVNGQDGKPITTVTTAHLTGWAKNGFLDSGGKQLDVLETSMNNTLYGAGRGNTSIVKTGLVNAGNALAGIGYQQGHLAKPHQNETIPQAAGNLKMPITAPITKLSAAERSKLLDKYPAAVVKKPAATTTPVPKK